MLTRKGSFKLMLDIRLNSNRQKQACRQKTARYTRRGSRRILRGGSSKTKALDKFFYYKHCNFRRKNSRNLF